MKAFKDFQKWKMRWETADPEFTRQTKTWFKKLSFKKSRKFLALKRELRLLRAECFGPWDLSRTSPKWERSQVFGKFENLGFRRPRARGEES